MRGLALALGTAMALVLGEIVYRATRLVDLSPTTHPGYVVHHEELGWAYLPNARERHATAEFDVEIAINAHGFRGPDWPATFGAPGRKTVLVLGDSFAFGWGVEWSSCFCARLAEAHPEWDVLDAAVSGYGTDQQWLVLQRLRPVVRPDVVVCVFCINDLWESCADMAYGRRKPVVRANGDRLEVCGVPVASSLLERASALWCAVQKKAWEFRFASAVRDSEAEWAHVERLYRAMRDELNGVPLLLVSDERRIALFAAGEPAIEHLDTGPLLDREPLRGRFAVDGHWNAAGHAVVARGLDQKLQQMEFEKR